MLSRSRHSQDGGSGVHGKHPPPAAQEIARFYIETDGKVYTVEEAGMVTLPTPDHKLPFDMETIDELDLKGVRVAFCRPHLERHPKEWMDKDEVPYLENAAPVLQAAVNRSLTRGIANVALVRDRKVLVVQGARGMTAGMWHFPGGFISMGETPEEGVLREVEEEVGLKIRLTDLIAVFQFKTALSYYIQGFFYSAETMGRNVPRPDPDEIAAIRWDPIEEAD